MKLPAHVRDQLVEELPLAQALALHRLGFNPFPVRVGEKAPYVEWKRWQGKRLPESQVRAWFEGLTESNFWLMCGAMPGGVAILVLDVDSQAAERFWRVEMGLSELLDRTACVETANGHHYYFKLPAGAKPQGWAFHEEVSFDVRAGGGGVIAPPSIHETGAVYQWVRDPSEVELLEAPRALLDGKAAKAKLGKSSKGDPANNGDSKSNLGQLLDQPPTAGGRNDWLTQVAGHYAKAFRNWQPSYLDQVNRANLLCTPPLEVAEMHKVADSIWQAEHGDEGIAQLMATAASAIKLKRVRWLWLDRLPLGELALIPGREGLGKSLVTCWLAAQLTHGRLPGEFFGQPKSVLVCATEDSWEHTIVPRLLAAGADLDRVFRIEVVQVDLGVKVGLSLPRDNEQLRNLALATDAALLVLDPLMSRLDSKLDSHKDHEVRLALEPLVEMAHEVGLAVAGVIHHNKSGSADPLHLVMGSKAFTAVARSVHSVVPDPGDESGARRLFGTTKNNLGRSDLPTMSFTVTGFQYPTDDGSFGWTGQLVWGEDHPTSIAAALEQAQRKDRGPNATDRAAEWLRGWLAEQPPRYLANSKDAKAAGRKAGHSERALERAVKDGDRGVFWTELRERNLRKGTVWCLEKSEWPVGAAEDQLPLATGSEGGS